MNVNKNNMMSVRQSNEAYAKLRQEVQDNVRAATRYQRVAAWKLAARWVVCALLVAGATWWVVCLAGDLQVGR